ncbi:MAG: sodium:solute symporter family protein, partial [Verrucomicrobia bacterium]|nr:sodium:solute symporter family protein [Verrucomicrobiota bacterium]
YKPLLKNRTPKHYMLVGRWVSGLIVLSGVICTFWMSDVISGLKFWLKIAPMLGIAFWIGLFWKRYNSVGAWVSTLTGFSVWWLTLQPGVVHRVQSLPFAKSLGLIQQSADKSSIHEPWQIMIYLSAAALAGIIASLLTRRPDSSGIERFHQLIRTPVQSGEVITESCHLPQGVNPNFRPTWFAGTDFELPVPSKTSIMGFIVCWLAVGGMIGGFILMVQS